MKIGRRIAFYYMWVTLGITGALVVVFYFYTSRYIDNVYYSYLAEKALVTAGKHWERDEVNAQDYALIQKRYNELLPTTGRSSSMPIRQAFTAIRSDIILPRPKSVG